jgi:biopolymer transport protein TolQ
MVVKIVMIILLVASLLTWIVIVERYNFFQKIKKINTSFHTKFWSGEDLDILYNEIANEEIPLYGSLNVFKSSYKEYKLTNSDKHISELDL